MSPTFANGKICYLEIHAGPFREDKAQLTKVAGRALTSSPDQKGDIA